MRFVGKGELRRRRPRRRPAIDSNLCSASMKRNLGAGGAAPAAPELRVAGPNRVRGTADEESDARTAKVVGRAALHGCLDSGPHASGGPRSPSVSRKTQGGYLQRRLRLQRFLIVLCVVLAVLFGLVAAFDEDGDFSVAVWPAATPSCSQDETSRELSGADLLALLSGPAVRIGIRAPGLLAAVPGGLCLLI